MSTREEWFAGLDGADSASKSHCSICGTEHWHAMWMGQVEIYVCSSCACTVLPRLIADSRHYLTLPYVNGALECMGCEYWRAIALRLIRATQKKDPEIIEEGERHNTLLSLATDMVKDNGR